MPPSPSRPRSRNSPSNRGSSAVKAFMPAPVTARPDHKPVALLTVRAVHDHLTGNYPAYHILRYFWQPRTVYARTGPGGPENGRPGTPYFAACAVLQGW